MSSGGGGRTATLLKDGHVLVAGGGVDTAQLYDPKSGTFAATGRMTDTPGFGTATLLLDGRVLIAGGAGNSAELYDPASGTFTATGSSRASRAYHTATLLADGRVLLAGGMDDNVNYLATAELYDPARGEFTATGTMKNARENATATRLADGRVLIAGGDQSVAQPEPGQLLATAEIYDPSTGRFAPTGSMLTRRTDHTATRLADGRVLIAGGDNPDGSPTMAEVYDPKSGKFTRTGSMSTGRETPTATLLGDGRVLIAGGLGDVYVRDSLVLDSAELYDPATGKFSQVGSMATARHQQTATLLEDGRVLIDGGEGEDGPVDSAELYWP